MSSRYKDVANQQAVVEAVNPQRRLLFQRAGLLSVACFEPSALRTAWTHGDDRPDSLFTLGVASGDPSSHGVVLWTRLAPDPLHSSGGMDDRYLQNAHAASPLS